MASTYAPREIRVTKRGAAGGLTGRCCKPGPNFLRPLVRSVLLLGERVCPTLRSWTKRKQRKSLRPRESYRGPSLRTRELSVLHFFSVAFSEVGVAKRSVSGTRRSRQSGLLSINRSTPESPASRSHSGTRCSSSGNSSFLTVMRFPILCDISNSTPIEVLMIRARASLPSRECLLLDRAIA